MKIELKEITIRELVSNYENSDEQGVKAYGGKLDVRPAYQREFVYKDKQRDAVIETVMNGFPLNVMYWAVRDDGTYEIIDGQQRTISLCEYYASNFSCNNLFLHNLPEDKKKQFLDYKLMIYVCDGDASEKLKWFETINIAGEKLYPQELRNAVYSGNWVSDAKRYFSKRGCAAEGLGSDYLSGSAIRQDYLQTAIEWMAKKEHKSIVQYMGEHQHDANALALWQYFQSVITWLKATFPKKRVKFMRGVAWGELYNTYGDEVLDAKVLEKHIAKLILDDDVTNKKGIYAYVLSGDEKYLSIRTFSDAQKQKAYEKQKGICKMCKNSFELAQMEGDHITPWSDGGKTEDKNLQMLCKLCNRTKSNK